MKNRKIEVFVEKASDGTYWGTSQNFEGVVNTYGDTLEQLQENFSGAFADHLEVAKETGEKYANDYDNVTFVYNMDLSSFFDLVPEIKISSIAKKAKMNESLLRQYKSGHAVASQDQVKKIQEAIHDLGRELLSVEF